MAKKKKSAKKNTKKLVATERSPFWDYAAAILLMLAAVFLLIGGFGTGGALPINLFHGTYWTLGWVAYLTPVALVYWGVTKFMSEDRQIPLSKLFGMTALLVFASSWVQVTFKHGGAVGRVIGNVVLGALDKIPASLLFFVLTLLAVFFAFGISLVHLLKIGNLFKRPEREGDEGELAALKAKASESNFKLNEGVPVIHHTPGEQPRLSSLKNTAQRLTGTESHEALTTASDPNWQFPSIDL